MLVLTSGIVGSQVFADKCSKNHDDNCNHPDKNQNSNPKINCQIHIDATDGTNNDYGPNNQQCQNNSNNIRDSTIIQTSPGNNGQSPFTVESTTPSDGDNNVALDSDVTVTFSEKIDKNTVDTGSLSVFNLDQAIDPDVQDVSVSGKTATFTLRSTSGGKALLPNTEYEATISSAIKDQNGNSLDCESSKGVDSNCQWQFSTGSNSSPEITLNPTSGPVLTSVSVTGTGFDPLSVVTLTFDGTTVATATTTSTGSFTANFAVPFSSSTGDHTVKASQGSKLASKTFKVTVLLNPTIFLNTTSGPVGTPVEITGSGFDPSSTVGITFNGSTITTTPATVTTTANGFFFANFTVPATSIGPVPVIATQGVKSDSETFTVTSNTGPLTSSLSTTTSQSSVSSLVPTSPF